MKKTLTLLGVLALAACEPVQDEFYTSGGYVAPLLDKTTFRAVTQREQFHRYYYVAAVAAPLALYTVTDEDGADDTIGHVARTFKQLKRYDQSLKNCVERHKILANRDQKRCDLAESASNGSTSLDVRDSSYGFEINGLETQRNLARLASDVKNNVGLQIDAQNPLSAVENIVGILRRTKELIGPLRNFAASYRDTLHITTLSVARLCQSQFSDPKSNCKALRNAVDSYYEAGSSPSAVFLPEGKEQERALKTLRGRFEAVITSGELGNQGFLDDEAIKALNALMFTSCKHAARYTEWDSEEVKEVCSALKIPSFTPDVLEQAGQDANNTDPTQPEDTAVPRSLEEV